MGFPKHVDAILNWNGLNWTIHYVTNICIHVQMCAWQLCRDFDCGLYVYCVTYSCMYTVWLTPVCILCGWQIYNVYIVWFSAIWWLQQCVHCVAESCTHSVWLAAVCILCDWQLYGYCVTNSCLYNVWLTAICILHDWQLYVCCVTDSCYAYCVIDSWKYIVWLTAVCTVCD